MDSVRCVSSRMESYCVSALSYPSSALFYVCCLCELDMWLCSGRLIHFPVYPWRPVFSIALYRSLYATYAPVARNGQIRLPFKGAVSIYELLFAQLFFILVCAICISFFAIVRGWLLVDSWWMVLDVYHTRSFRIKSYWSRASSQHFFFLVCAMGIVSLRKLLCVGAFHIHLRRFFTLVVICLLYAIYAPVARNGQIRLPFTGAVSVYELHSSQQFFILVCAICISFFANIRGWLW
jgi:hypothetical protein